MEQRRIGQTDLVTSCLGIGGNRFARLSSEDRRRDVEATVHAAIDNGITFIDLSDVHGNGLAEEIVGAALGHRRDRLILCSKAGRVQRGRTGRLLSRPFSARYRRRSVLSPGHIRVSIEASLRRLRTDRLDLFMLHSPPYRVLKQLDLFETLEDLKQAGKVRHYGISPLGAIGTREALAWLEAPGIAALQIVANALHLVDLETVVSAAEARRVGLIARQPFHKRAVLRDDRMRRLAAAHPVYSTAQLALRFSIQLGGFGPVLAGMSRPAHLEENLGALDGPALTAEEMRRLREMATVA